MSWFDEHFLPYRISETLHGNTQYQNFFMPNEVQMPQVMLPYQPFPSPSVGPPLPMLSQTLTPVMQPALDAAGMLWRPPTVTVANANNNPTAANNYYHHHHRPNEQHISNSSCRGGPSENCSTNKYGQMEIEQMVNRYQRGNREYTEKQLTEAAFNQNIEESLKLSQQHRKTYMPYGRFQTPNGPVIHVGSVQHHNFFMSNAVQIPQNILHYQPFPPPSVGPPPPMPSQTPTPVMQPALDAAGMLWRPPTVTVANANSNPTAANNYYHHHHRPNEQHISNSSRGNLEKDAYKEIKRAKQPQYSQGSAGGSKSWSGGVPSENGSNNEYEQVEIERMVNRHHRCNREHTEMQRAEAAVHKHFEESLNLAQQQRLQVHYRNRCVHKSNYDHENVLANANDSGNTENRNNMIQCQIPLFPGPLLNTHLTFKLKKAWLEKHVWEEDLKEAGVNIDQNASQSFSQMDDTSPVLQCEIIKKKQISNNSSDANTEVTSLPVILPITSSTLYELSTSSTTAQRCRKRKISNNTTSSETKITTDNTRPSETKKKVPPIKILTKRGRKPKIIVSIPLKKVKNNDDEVRFFNIFKNQYNIATNKSLNNVKI